MYADWVKRVNIKHVFFYEPFKI